MFEREYRYCLRAKTDDTIYCQRKDCRRKTCKRNQMHIKDKTVPHSFYVERPPDCPYRKKQDDFYHIREKTLEQG